MEVCKESDFIEAVEKLKGEMPADDTSHFDLASAGSNKTGETAEVTIDSLWTEYDRIVDEGLSERSDEYQELREKIRQFAEDNELDVRLARSKNNQQLLDEIERALDDKKGQAAPAKAEVKADVEDDEPEKEEKSVEETPARRRPRPTIAEAEEEVEEVTPAEETNNNDEAPAEEAERPLHRRRRR